MSFWSTVRVVLRNALTWAVGWGVAGGVIVTGLSLFNPGDFSILQRLGFSLLAGAGWGVRFAVIGAVMGTLFSTFVRLSYHGRRISDISPVRFALLGAVVGGVGLPLFLQSMHLLSDGALMPWGLVRDDAVLAAVFGAAAAGGTILLARRAERLAGGHGAEALGPETGSSAQLAPGAASGAGGERPVGFVPDARRGTEADETRDLQRRPH